MLQNRVPRGTLQVASQLDEFVAQQVVPGTGVELDKFWAGVRILRERTWACKSRSAGYA